jgi:hypothetical protein
MPYTCSERISVADYQPIFGVLANANLPPHHTEPVVPLVPPASLP